MSLLKFLKSDNLRTKSAQRNVLLLFANKILAALISLQLIPATLGYVESTQYGIWITLSSIVAWMIYFDMGLTHGFRNSFAEAKANGDMKLANEYVSTSYVLLTIIFISLLVLLLVANYWINWSTVLNVDKALEGILHNVFSVIIVFFSAQMVFNLISTLLLADQKPAISAMIVTVGQLLALIVIYILTFFTKGSLLYLAYALMGVPTLSLILVTILFFKTKLKEYTPSLKKVNLKLSKNIIGLGSKFFVIQLSMLFVFQFSNIILSRVLGPEAVTEYNITYRYFSLIYITMSVIFIPFWSAFTEAYTKGELGWMKSTYQKLSKIWCLTIVLFAGLLLISPFAYKYWLAEKIDINIGLSIAMGLNMIILSRANLYMTCINGTGKIFMQMLIYLFFALISIPMMFYFTKLWGYYGILIVTSIVYLCQSISGHIQLKMIFNGKEHGVWKK